MRVARQANFDNVLEHIRRTGSHPNYRGYDALRGRHADRYEAARPFLCPGCGRGFKAMQSLEQHLRDTQGACDPFNVDT